MRRWLAERAVDAVVDATHPFAATITAHAAQDAEVIDVGLIERMFTRGAGAQLPLIPTPPAAASRFVRASSDFAVRRPS